MSLYIAWSILPFGTYVSLISTSFRLNLTLTFYHQVPSNNKQKFHVESSKIFSQRFPFILVHLVSNTPERVLYIRVYHKRIGKRLQDSHIFVNAILCTNVNVTIFVNLMSLNGTSPRLLYGYFFKLYTGIRLTVECWIKLLLTRLEVGTTLNNKNATNSIYTQTSATRQRVQERYETCRSKFHPNQAPNHRLWLNIMSV